MLLYDILYIYIRGAIFVWTVEMVGVSTCRFFDNDPGKINALFRTTCIYIHKHIEIINGNQFVIKDIVISWLAIFIGLNKSAIAFNHEIYTAFISSPLLTRFSKHLGWDLCGLFSY